MQRLAHACWNSLRDGRTTPLTAGAVAAVLDRLVARDDPFYTQMWNRMTTPQQKALLATVDEGGRGMFAKAVLRRYGMALSTMRTSLEALVRSGITREEEARGSVRQVLEDPFFAAWLRQYVQGP